MPQADQALAVLGSALRDPNVVPRYPVKIDAVPGSECLWWSGAVSVRGHGRKRAELASRARLARRPAMGLASPAPNRCTAVDAAARRGSLVLLYGQTPTRIVTLTQHDVTRLDGMTYITLHRQPVLMPTRLADLGRPARRVQHRAPATARIRQSRFTLAIPRRTTWRTPTSRISRHVAE